MNPFAKDPNVPAYVIPACGDVRAIRKHDIHLGIDIYLEEGTEVILPERTNGELGIPTSSKWTVKNIETFTGPNSIPPTNWWKETQAVFLECEGQILVFGEIKTDLQVGQKLSPGDTVGFVLPVLQKDNGMPPAMLHLERWSIHLYEWLTRVWNVKPFSSFALERTGMVDSRPIYTLAYQNSNGLACEAKLTNSDFGAIWQYGDVNSFKTHYVLHQDTFLQDRLAENLSPGSFYTVEPVKRIFYSHYMYGDIYCVEGRGKGFDTGLSDHAPYCYLGKHTSPLAKPAGYKNGLTVLQFLQEEANGSGSKIIEIHGSYRASTLFKPLT